MEYSDLTTRLGDLLVIPITDSASATPSSDTNFNNILSAIITDAEQRIYREIDFLATRTEDFSLTFTANVRTLTIPDRIIIVQDVNVITPAGEDPDDGTRNQIQPVSLPYLNFTWPQAKGAGATGVPTMGSMLDATTIIVAPTPDDDYTAEFIGIFRPLPMSSVNISTYLGTHYPDLFLAACMVFATGYQRDFGAQSENPQMSVSWESHYMTLKQSVMEESQRQKWQSTGWSALQAAPLSTPQRP